jgi:hypothetical protein
LLFIFRFIFLNEFVIAKQPFFDTTIRVLDFAHAFLDTLHPRTLINSSIVPVHFPVSVSEVYLKTPLVVVSWRPSVFPLAFLFVECVFSFVGCNFDCVVKLAGWEISRTCFFPDTAPVARTGSEGAFVDHAILPFEAAFSVEFAFQVHALVFVTIGEDVVTMTMLEALVPFALVLVAIWPFMNSKAMRFRSVPVTIVTLTL